MLEADQLLFSERPVAWQDWVAAWERDQAGEGIPKPLVPGMRLLPPGPANGWNKTVYVRDPHLAGAVSVLEYPGEKNGWNRLVLRGEVTKLSVILIEWDTL